MILKKITIATFIALALLCMILETAFAQAVDVVIDKGIYQSYFNRALKQPVFVAYKLYQGGGSCIRSKYHFLNDSKIPTATKNDYAHSGYDEGHLANAEDFAGNCKHDELTFRFYNCLPQTAGLNRGAWKVLENRVRKLSQKDSLLVICGGIWCGKPTSFLNAPDSCWKVVQSLKSKKILIAQIFANNRTFQWRDCTVKEIENLIKNKIPLK